ncbi:hypothetical protein Gorai_016553, partial [Gossypium raimondii]|nr:hypothetical protein [Gossypium raimondii]
MFEWRLGLGENKVLLLDDVVCRVVAKRPLVGWDLDDFPECIWQLDCPQRVRVFLWLVAQNKVLTSKVALSIELVGFALRGMVSKLAISFLMEGAII